MSSTAFLRCLAILIIVNSHSEAFYPISQLATGGAIGNSLFFALSSFGLYFSEQKNPRPFVDWYTRRAVRIYPTIWVTLVVLLFPMLWYNGEFQFNNLLAYAGEFFYPNSRWWFLSALLVYYFFLYFIIKNYNHKKLTIAAIVGISLYAYAYLNFVDLSAWTVEDYLPFKFIFYFSVFLFGVYLAAKHNQITRSFGKDATLLCGFIVLMYGHKYLMTRGLPFSTQFMQQVLLFPIVYYFFKVSQSELISTKLMNLPVVSGVIRFIASITLEIYLVHILLLPPFRQLALPFPVGWALFIATAFTLAVLIHYLTQQLVSISTLGVQKSPSVVVESPATQIYHGTN